MVESNEMKIPVIENPKKMMQQNILAAQAVTYNQR